MTHAVDHTKRRERTVKFFLFGGVVALPLTIGVINLAAFLILGSQYPDDRVADDFYKQALHVHKNAEPVRLAQQLHIQATLKHYADDGRLQLTLKGQHQQPAALQLRLLHGADASKDLQLVLTRHSNNEYISQFEGELGRYSDVKLSPIAATSPWLVESTTQHVKAVKLGDSDYWVVEL